MTFEKIQTILADYKSMDASAITMTSSFSELGLDSLDTVEIVMAIEDEFGISIETSDSLKTVADLVELVDKSV